MNYVLVDNANIVRNLISYDGISPYNPGNGLTLQSTTNQYEIGDTFHG